MTSVPSNGLQNLLDAFKKASIEKSNLSLKNQNHKQFREDLENFQAPKSNVYSQLYYLTQDYSEEYYSIPSIKGYPPVVQELKVILEGMLESSELQFLDPQQYFNYILDNRRIKNPVRIGQIKESKWGGGKLIQKFDKGIFYYLKPMDKETAKNELERWNLGFEKPRTEFNSDSFEVSCCNLEDSENSFCPVFKVPYFTGMDLNEAFSNPIHHAKIISEIVTIEDENFKIKRLQNIDGKNMEQEFNFIKQQFPRLNNRWNELDRDLKCAVFRCYLDIKNQDFKVRHKRGTPFAHGDEWGGNFFFMRDNGRIFAIDFEDLIILDDSDIKFGNSYLAQRIWIDVSLHEDRYMEASIESDIISSKDVIFDVVCSSGRLFSALIQFWIESNKHYLAANKDTVDLILTNLFFNKNLEGKDEWKLKVEWDNLNSGSCGWFFLAAIDWALHWEKRKPNQIHSKFPKLGMDLLFEKIIKFMEIRCPNLDYYSTLVSKKLKQRIDINNKFELLQRNFPFVTGDDKQVYEKYRTNQPFDREESLLADLLSWHVGEKNIQHWNQNKKIIVNLTEEKRLLDRLKQFNEVGFQTEILGQENSNLKEIESFLNNPLTG